MSETRATTPVPVKILSVSLLAFGSLAFVGSLFLWGEGFLLQFPKGADYSFPMADLFVNAPASILAAFGLWRLKRYGYAASQFCAGFYLYASVIILTQIAQGALPASLEIILPQVLAILVAIVLIFYLWRIKAFFH